MASILQRIGAASSFDTKKFNLASHRSTSVRKVGFVVVRSDAAAKKINKIGGRAELAKLDKTERRYTWVKRRLRTNEDIWKTFPASWHVDYLLCIQFCKLTRKQLKEILENLKEKPDVGTLLLALQRTIEFEEELAEKFGGSGSTKSITSDIEDVEKGENNNQIVMYIKKKYERKLAAHQGNQENDKDDNKDTYTAVPGAWFNFRSIISSCFEPHLIVYVELEERTVMEHLETLVQEERWDMDDGSQTNILSSSMQQDKMRRV